MRTSLVGLGLVLAAGAQAAVVEQPVVYTVGDAEMTSTLVYDDAGAAKRPGIVMVPNWFGATAATIERAKKLAGDDYVVLVADVFGTGVRPADGKEASAQVTKLFSDTPMLRARATEALAQLRAQAGKAPLDPDKVAAIGYCFGGSTALELARAGADVDAVVSFHGGLKTQSPAKPGSVKASVLVLNGADDGNIKPEDIAGFEQEMKAANADWQFVNLSGAVHCFAEEDANRPPGCVYHERSAKRGYEMMNDLFAEKFASP
jgi:dienelactone hydrolase